MKNNSGKTISILFSFLLVTTIVFTASAKETFQGTASYIKSNVSPSYGDVGGEWSVIGLTRGGSKLSTDNTSKYLSSVKQKLIETSGSLHRSKSTEYSRLILALTSLGKDPCNFEGYNLTNGLSDDSFVAKQGLNGTIFALLALDSGDYASKGNVSRQKLLRTILSAQKENGGFSLNIKNSSADADVTAMALQALAPYKKYPPVKKSIENALVFLSKSQSSDGSFFSYGEACAESSAQVTIALCTLGIDPNKDTRFIKNGVSVYDNLLSFSKTDRSFCHTKSNGAKSNLMATEQALCALAAYERYLQGKSSLYDMSNYKCSFTDISESLYKDEIMFLNKHAIITGVSEENFAPSKNVTRAQFCTMLCKALGLESDEKTPFVDVKINDWFYSYVCAAYQSGIVNGKSQTSFYPNDYVTKQEACVMLARAAKNFSPVYPPSSSNSALPFSDSDKISAWAKQSVSFCLANHITNDTRNFNPQKSLSREELASMFFGFWFLI